MEVAVPMDFDFNNSLSNDGGYYTSAPSSPTRLTDVYCEFDELLIASATANHRGNCLAAVPFAWEEKPGVPKSLNNSFEDDFSFDVSCHFGTDSVQLPAEDLFHGGIIKTVDPNEKKEGRERGRERGSSFSRLPSSRSRRTRSLSPLGSSDQRREQQLRATYMIPPLTATTNSSVAPSGANSSENGSRKWSFMDFLLFRSASDGRAMDRDPLKKYSATFRKHDQDIRNSGSVSKRKGRVSAHEIHYNVNRAVSNDMKKKTYLPYKQGILGRFSFNP